ncbi:MAG: MTH938/NDUFAF3 family protein [bacterium]
MIDKYSFGAITIDGTSYQSDVIIYPGHVDDKWWRKEGHLLHIEDIEAAFSYEPEVIIVGTGHDGIMKVAPDVEGILKNRKIQLIVKKTANACNIYNELSKNKKVVATLHLTC